MIELRSINGKTGQALRTLLGERGIVFDTPFKAIVSWGRTVTTDLPCLNGNAGRLNKFEELQRLAERGIPTPAHFSNPDGLEFNTEEAAGTWLGRKLKHTKGKDIVILKSPFHQRGNAFSDFYTAYVPQIHEFRVWVFRGKCLGVYQKVLRYPNKAKKRPGIAWNWDRGFAFAFFHNPPDALKQLGIDAVRALDLDFGAVDILQAEKDKKYYVLEVNTAPGTRGEPRQGLTYLATKIARWCQNGFKRRREWKEN